MKRRHADLGVEEVHRLLDVGVPHRPRRGHAALRAALLQPGDGRAVRAVDVEGDQVVAAHARGPTVRVADVEGALREPNRIALLIPANEKEVVLDLDGSRERILAPRRTQPIVLFLIRGGDGQRTLAQHAPSLRSWLSGSDADPERLAEVDPEEERVAFVAATGKSPEDFLVLWRSGQLADTSANLGCAYRAILLERVP